MQSYLLKNSPRSTLLLLLRGGQSQKVNDLYIGLIVVHTIVRVRYLYPESKHESYLSTICYNLWYERKYSYLKITWTLIFPLLQSPICIFLAPIISCHRHLLTSFGENRSSVAFDPADINLYSIDSLIGIILEACEFLRSSPKFWCKQKKRR